MQDTSKQMAQTYLAAADRFGPSFSPSESPSDTLISGLHRINPYSPESCATTRPTSLKDPEEDLSVSPDTVSSPTTVFSDLFADFRRSSPQTSFNRLKLFTVQCHKQRGNDAFAAEALDEALREWDVAIQLLRQMDDPDVESSCQLAACLSNASEACFNRRNFSDALRYATEALAVDPKQAKSEAIVRDTLSLWGYGLTE